jgi:hypothetical protein
MEKPLNQLTELVNDTTSKKMSMLEKLAKKKVCVTPVIEESNTNTQTNKRRGRPLKQDNLPIVPLVTDEVINEIVKTPLNFVGYSLLEEMEEVANDAVHDSVIVENRDILLNDAEKIISHLQSRVCSQPNASTMTTRLVIVSKLFYCHKLVLPLVCSYMRVGALNRRCIGSRIRQLER